MAKTPATAAPLTDERPYNHEEFTAWLTESCRRQRLPVTVTNPTVLANIATLLR